MRFKDDDKGGEKRPGVAGSDPLPTEYPFGVIVEDMEHACSHMYIITRATIYRFDPVTFMSLMKRYAEGAIANDAELEMVKPLGFLTLKPLVVAVNIGEDGKSQKLEIPGDTSTPIITVCAKIEYELSQLDPESRQQFMADLGITESAAGKFVHACFKTLVLISFLTVGPDEVRAWPIKQGTTAHDAAGKVHSDIKRGFIRAETFGYSDIKQLGDEKTVKAAGKFRLEGKEYVVRDGDIINFRFNV